MTAENATAWVGVGSDQMLVVKARTLGTAEAVLDASIGVLDAADAGAAMANVSTGTDQAPAVTTARLLGRRGSVTCSE